MLPLPKSISIPIIIETLRPFTISPSPKMPALIPLKLSLERLSSRGSLRRKKKPRKITNQQSLKEFRLLMLKLMMLVVTL